MPIVKPKWKKRLAATLCSMLLLCAAFLLEYSTDNGASWTAVFSREGDNVQPGGCTSPRLADGQLTTGESGNVTFSGLRADSSILYRLTETKAPDGHSLLGSPLYIGTLPVEIAGTAVDTETVDGVTFGLIERKKQGQGKPTMIYVYLGGNEQSTHKYVSELLGKETISTKSSSQSKGRNGSYSQSIQQTGRDLMTPDEVRLLDNKNAIVFIRGERPVIDEKYDLMKHPNIQFTEDGGAAPYVHSPHCLYDIRYFYESSASIEIL